MPHGNDRSARFSSSQRVRSILNRSSCARSARRAPRAMSSWSRSWARTTLNQRRNCSSVGPIEEPHQPCRAAASFRAAFHASQTERKREPLFVVHTVVRPPQHGHRGQVGLERLVQRFGEMDAGLVDHIGRPDRHPGQAAELHDLRRVMLQQEHEIRREHDGRDRGDGSLHLRQDVEHRLSRPRLGSRYDAARERGFGAVPLEPPRTRETTGVLLVGLDARVEHLPRDVCRRRVPDPVDRVRHAHQTLQVDALPLADHRDYLEADSDAPTAAWPAASRAVSTRNGEQLT